MLRPVILRSALMATALTSFQAHAGEQYAFDTSLLRGNVANTTDFATFSGTHDLSVGEYPVDLYLNHRFIGRSTVAFRHDAAHQVAPCFDHSQWSRLGLRNPPQEADQACLFAGEGTLSSMSVQADMTRLRLEITIPQSLLNHRPRGSVDEAALNSGDTMAFVNYSANQYYAHYRPSSMRDLASTYINVNAGINAGLWRYRQQSSLSYGPNMGQRWHTQRRYVQRAILPLQSELLAGEGFTNGQFFEGVGFRGVQLRSDDRMLPDTQRGFAPVVRGLARTNAKVTVRQGDNTLYETTVSPGPFTIDDLYATYYTGDLRVTVTEADGQQTSFTVPFSSLPESLRPGRFRYTATLGRTRTDPSTPFGETTWQYGLSNTLTANLATQWADGYQAFLLGGVYGHPWGAFGLDTTYTRTRHNTDTITGSALHASFATTLAPTDTQLLLSAYRYMNDGYRGLSDALGDRDTILAAPRAATQRTRYELSLSQSLGDWGSVGATWSLQDYYHRAGRDAQYQLNWGKTFTGQLTMNLSIMRSHQTHTASGADDNLAAGERNDTRQQTYTSLSLSYPLGHSAGAPSLSFSRHHSETQGTSQQASLSGSVGDRRPLGYAMTVTENDRHERTWSGHLQTRLPYANVSGSLSTADDYWQASAAIQGALVVHRGGLTLGPYLGDTFALVEAPGASGATVLNGQGLQVDGAGYALIPSLQPYRYNTVSLTPQGMNRHAELVEGQQQVAPYAGAAVKLHFDTRSGQALLIRIERPDHGELPMGAEALDSKGHSVGMLGQANQLYVRSRETENTLTLKWGTSAAQQCRLHYHAGPDDTSPLQSLTARCE